MSKEAEGGGKRRGKKKDKKVTVSLYINGTPYEHGCLCTFCTKEKAVYHCSECPDFYCEGCDYTTHSTAKRKTHVRKKISHLTLKTAAKYITFAVRYHYGVLVLQKRARLFIRRYFDKLNLCHYYYNTKYGTVSWKKPYCLRKQELFPFIGPYDAATRIQGMYRMRKARHKVISLLLECYRKVFDRTKGRFYYTFKGASRIVPRQRWTKLTLLKRRAYPKDIEAIYTKDVAAYIIQTKWRAILVRKFLRAVTRVVYKEEWDPTDGTYKYLNTNTNILQVEKPKLLGSELWRPNNVLEWTQEQVVLFIRRIGLKCYVDKFVEFRVDGKAFCMIDDEDFDNMAIFSKIHRKKILVEMGRIFTLPNETRLALTKGHELRREKIKKEKLYKKSAIILQRCYRGHIARINVANMKEVIRVNIATENQKKSVLKSKVWWIQRDIPYQLPPIKVFGRKRDHLSAHGWGHWESGKFNPLENPKFQDGNPTKFYTQKLKISFYDKKRTQIFRANQTEVASGKVVAIKEGFGSGTMVASGVLAEPMNAGSGSGSAVVDGKGSLTVIGDDDD